MPRRNNYKTVVHESSRVSSDAETSTRLVGVASPLTKSQYARRLRALAELVDREQALLRVGLLDRYATRQRGRLIKTYGGDTHYDCVTVLRCGSLDVWVGLDVVTQTWTARIEGYPEVTDVVTQHDRVRDVSTAIRAAQHALAFLTQHVGPIAGAAYDSTRDQYALRVARAA